MKRKRMQNWAIYTTKWPKLSDFFPESEKITGSNPPPPPISHNFNKPQLVPIGENIINGGLTWNTDDTNLVYSVVFQRRGHVERFVWMSRVSQLVFIRIEILLMTNHLENLGERILVVDARHELLVPGKAHRQALRFLRM